MVKRCGAPSQGWRTFLCNHAPDIAAMDLFVAPTIGFDLLYVFVIIRLGRRNLVWINVTPHPTAEWIACQITEAFPWKEAPRYLIRDRDCVYGAAVTHRLGAMGIRDRPIAPGSPWQNGFAERLIGSIRRECVDHMVVLGEAHLRRILTKYAAYYNELRTHRSLGKDAPIHRAIQHVGRIASVPVLGGPHHHYCRNLTFRRPGCDAESASGHLHGDRAQKVALADVNAAMAQDRVGGCDVKIEVRQHEMVEVIVALHVPLVGRAERERDLTID